MKTGLVLEGGGTRGIYTSGALEFLYKNDIEFDHIIGTSMGACNGATYISKQPERNKKIFLKYFNDKRYFNLMNVFKKDKTILGMDFLFEKIPNQLVPFNYDNFLKSDINFTAVATDMSDGSPVYLEKNNLNNKKEVSNVLKATSSIPLVTEPVEYDNKLLVDGGVSDSIPIRKAIDKNLDRIIVILTRDHSYRKKPVPFKSIYKLKYKDYPELISAIENRYIHYNETIKRINQLEKNKEIIVIRPSRPISIDHRKTTLEDLDDILNLGIKDAFKKIDGIKDYLKK